MKESDIVVGDSYYSSRRVGGIAKSSWRRVVSMRREHDGKVTVQWKRLDGHGRPEGSCSLASFARWADRRTNRVQDGDKAR